MTWTARLVIPLLIVAIQSSRCYGQANNQWYSAELADKFISLFLGSVSMQSCFTIDQLEDMASIGETIMFSIDEMAKSGKNFKNRLQALDMAFATSIAEIAVEEQGGASLDVKTNAIENSLISAYLHTFGTVNQKFVNEVKSLISMFSQANANDVKYSGSSTSASSVGVAGIYGKSAGTGNIANYAKYGSAVSSSTDDGAVQTEEAAGYRKYGQGAGTATVTVEGALAGGQRGYDLGSVIGAGTAATALKKGASGYGGYEQSSYSASGAGSGAGRQGEYNTGTGVSASVVAKGQKVYGTGADTGGGQHGYDLGSVIGVGAAATALKKGASGYGGYEQASDSAYGAGSGAGREGEYNTGTGLSASVVAKGQTAYGTGAVGSADTGGGASKGSAGGYGGYAAKVGTASSAGGRPGEIVDYTLGSKADAFAGVGGGAAGTASKTGGYGRRPGFEIGAVGSADTGGGASKRGAGGYGGYGPEAGSASSAGTGHGGIGGYVFGSRAGAVVGVGGGAASTASKNGGSGSEIGAATGTGRKGGFDTNSREGAAAYGGRQSYYDIGSKTSTAEFGSQEVYGLAVGVGSGARVSAEGGTVVYEKINGKGENEAAGTSISNTVVNTVSRLSSSSSNQRVSSAAYFLLSSGKLDISSLTNVISNLSSSIIASNPGLSGCEVLVQVLIEVISALVHIISSSRISQVNLNVEDGSAIMVGQSIVSALG